MKDALQFYQKIDYPEFGNLITENLNLIASILGVIAFIGWILGCRPRTKPLNQKSYIDYQSNTIIETRELSIYWGHVPFFKKIKLPSIERNSKFTILCKPLGKMKNVLHTDNFSVNSSGSLTKIYLLNKAHFKKFEIETIFLETTRPSPSDYRKKIQINFNLTNIEVLNDNYLEVRQIPIKMPPTVTQDKILQYSPYLKYWETSGGTESQITGFLEKIPPREGQNSGRVCIPLI